MLKLDRRWFRVGKPELKPTPTGGSDGRL